MAGFPLGQEKAQAMAVPPLGVYVHVPFCATTCDFCAFYQTVPKGDAVRRYVDAVEAEAALVPWDSRRVETAFWGGGTPDGAGPGGRASDAIWHPESNAARGSTKPSSTERTDALVMGVLLGGYFDCC